MEVSYKTVYTLELISRIYKDIGIALRRDYFSVVERGDTFKCAAGGGSNRYHPSALTLGSVYQLRCFRRELVMLGVHFVVEHSILLHRSEGSQADVQGNSAYVYAHGFKLVKLFISEVQTGCRCCGRAYFVGIDRLIPLLVLQFFRDVRRQRHLTYLV